jgi:hypothetical protein
MKKLCPMALMWVLCLAVADRAHAQAPNVELMMKWAAVDIVHYATVGEYSGEPTILTSVKGSTRKARVADRVEFGFDWDPKQYKVVGVPTLKNFPSTLVSLTAVTGGPPPKMTGAYEHFDLMSVKGGGAPVIDLAIKTTYPAGAVPLANDVPPAPCGSSWDNATARSASSTMQIIVPPTMYFGAPMAMGEGGSISKDGKSFIFADMNKSGWTWTYTLTPVK